MCMILFFLLQSNDDDSCGFPLILRVKYKNSSDDTVPLNDLTVLGLWHYFRSRTPYDSCQIMSFSTIPVRDKLWYYRKIGNWYFLSCFDNCLFFLEMHWCFELMLYVWHRIDLLRVFPFKLINCEWTKSCFIDWQCWIIFLPFFFFFINE